MSRRRGERSGNYNIELNALVFNNFSVLVNNSRFVKYYILFIEHLYNSITQSMNMEEFNPYIDKNGITSLDIFLL